MHDLAATGAAYMPSRPLVLTFILFILSWCANFVEGGEDGICASFSTASGLATSSVTAGVAASYTIEARDSYYDLVRHTSESFLLNLWDESSGHSINSRTSPQPGAISAIVVANGGTGCTSGGTLRAANGGGFGFAATFDQAGGVIGTVTVTSVGRDYTSIPTIEIDTGGTSCTGFVLTPTMSVASDHLGSFMTTVSGKYRVSAASLRAGGLRASYYSNLWLYGQPALTRVDPVIDFDWGEGSILPGASDRVTARWEGALEVDLGVPQPRSGIGRSIRKVSILKGGSGCSSDGTLTASGGGGDGFSATFSIAGFVDVDGHYVVGIKSISITNPGVEYSSKPTITIGTGGTGCTGYMLEAYLDSPSETTSLFYAETDGGVKVWVDNHLIIDKWDADAFGGAGNSEQCSGAGLQECSLRHAVKCSESSSVRNLVNDVRSGYRELVSNACPSPRPSRTVQKEGAFDRSFSIRLPIQPIISKFPIYLNAALRQLAGVIGFAKDGIPFYAPSDGPGDDLLAKGKAALDDCNGHVDGNGVYHYHGDPTCVYDDQPGKHSPLLGFMLDGIPIYGPQDVNGTSASHISGVSKLDHCHGHTDSEHPFYHYHVVSHFPYTINCFRGCVEPTDFDGTNINIPSSGPCIPEDSQYDYSSITNTTWGSQGQPLVIGSTLKTYTGAIGLAVGGVYPFKVEYKHNKGPAALKLSWSPGLGTRSIISDLFQTNQVLWCGDNIPCQNATIDVQPLSVSAANSVISALRNMAPNVTSAVWTGNPLQILPRFEDPNFVASTGDLIFSLSTADAYGNSLTTSSTSLEVISLRHVFRGTAQGGSTTQVILPETASADDHTYNGMTVEIISGAGKGERAVISNYFGSSRTALASFSTAPDITSSVVVGPTSVPEVQDPGNGFYIVRQQMSRAANHTFWVRISGTTHVSGSPFHVRVLPGAFSAEMTTATIRYSWTAGVSQTLAIVAKDKFGNNITSEEAFPDSCTSKCGSVRFSVVLKTKLATSIVDRGSIASAGGANYFTLASSAETFPGSYVGMAINVGGQTRNITFHGSAVSSSTGYGRVVTVNSDFITSPSSGDLYSITRITDLVSVPKRVCKVRDTSVGLYEASCAAMQEIGEYEFEIAALGTPISGSPFRIIVVPSWKCASKSTASGQGLTLVTAGAAASFTITTKDSFSQPCTTGGDGFTIRAERNGAISPIQYFSYCTPTLNSCFESNTGIGTQTLTDLSTGAYVVGFEPTRSGTYRLNIRLGTFNRIFGSPFDMRVKAGGICATKSTVRGDGLTLATSGSLSRFTVVAKDEYSNNVEFLDLTTTSCISGGASGTCLLAVAIGDETFNVVPKDSGILSHQSESSTETGWDVSYTIDTSFTSLNYSTTLVVDGSNIPSVMPGGLHATYYDDTSFTTPVVTRNEGPVDFSGDGIGYSAGLESEANMWPWAGVYSVSPASLLLADSAFSVRWTGFLKPDAFQRYTFSTGLGGTEDRLKLWVDTSLIIDQWTSLATQSPTGQYRFETNWELFEITVDYKAPSNTFRAVDLYWDSFNTTGRKWELIPSQRLYKSSKEFTTFVKPRLDRSGSLSTATGNGLSLATVGTYAYATITARDMLGTLRQLDGQDVSFYARSGSEQGGLAATYYSDGEFRLAASTAMTNVDFTVGTTTLRRDLRVPIPADGAMALLTASAAALNAVVGDHLLVDSEVMRVVAIDGDVVTVARGQMGTAVVFHTTGSTVYNRADSNAPNSARFEGLVRPQYAEEYTFTVAVLQADERVKLWVDDMLLVDAWSSISATQLTASFDSSFSNGYYSIKVEYKHQSDLHGYSLSWSSATEALAVVPTDRLYSGNSMLHAEIEDLEDGTYTARYLSTHSGSYQTFVALAAQGGLSATYYSDTACETFAASRIDPAVNFDWGQFRPQVSTPFDNFCVRWSGMIRPEFTEEHTFILDVDDSAKLWIDNNLLIDTQVDGAVSRAEATVLLTSSYLYPIKLQYKEQSGKASVKLSWKSASRLGTSINYISLFPDSTCVTGTNGLEQCISPATASGGMNYVDGDIVVAGGNPNATATFAVDTLGSITDILLTNGGSGYSTEPSSQDVKLLYSGTQIEQTFSVTSIEIESAGSGFITGTFLVKAGNYDAIGSIEVTSGAVSKIFFTSHGSAYDLHVSASDVDIFYGASNTTQISTVTSVTVSGTAAGTYTSEGVLDVTCAGACTGSELAGTCTVRSGAVISIEISNHGSGYSASNPPTLDCPGSSGQTFTPVIAEGAVLSPRVAVGAKLEVVLQANSSQVIPSSRLYGALDPVSGWAGSSDYQTLEINPLDLCGSASTISTPSFGWRSSLSTVGLPVTFSIQARDEYGNIRTGPDGSTTSPDDFLTVQLAHADATFESLRYEGAGISANPGYTGRYEVSFDGASTSRAGVRNLNTRLAVQGGLTATYYLGAEFGWGTIDPYSQPDEKLPALNRADPTVDFSGSSGIWPDTPVCLSSTFPFTVRWAGFFKQTSGAVDTYTFSASLNQPEERIRLWLSNALLIDQWASLSSITPSMASDTDLSSGQPYSIEIEYKTNSQTRAVTLYQTISGATTVVSSSNLYQVYDCVCRFPTILALPDSVSGSNSLLSGDGVSVATASSSALFTITARDTFSNVVSDEVVPFVVRVATAGYVASKGSVSTPTSGTYPAIYTMTTVGSHTLSVSIPLQGGLHATYFTQADLTDGASIRVDPMNTGHGGSGDSASEVEWPGRAGESLSGAAFSVRWEGFVKPTFASPYEFNINVGDSDDRIKLWVDNILVIEQWASLETLASTGTFHLEDTNVFYDIKVEYKETAGVHGMTMKWSIAPTTEIVIDDQGCQSGCSGITTSVLVDEGWILDTLPAGFYSTGYYQDGGTNKGELKITKIFTDAFGVYELQIFFPSDASFSPAVPVEIEHDGQISTWYVDQTQGGGAWQRLATVAARGPVAVTISNKDTSGVVVVDAIKFVRTEANSDRVVDCGVVERALNARTFALPESASTMTQAYLHKFMIIGSERRRIVKYVGARREVTVDQAFSSGVTSLAADITLIQTSFLVTDAQAAGISVGKFIEIDYEILLVSSVVGNTIVAQRAQQQTTALAHVSGTEVRTVLLPARVVDSGVVAAVTSTSVLQIAASAPTRVDTFQNYEISIGFETSLEARTITSSTSLRDVTVTPAFTQLPIAGTSTYSISSFSHYSITDIPITDELGGECFQCRIPPQLLFTAPRVQETVSGLISVDRTLVASGPALTLATAGIASTFTVTLKDIYGNVLTPDDTIVYANGTLITSTYGYGSVSLVTGALAAGATEYSFTLSEAAAAVAEAYVGHYVTVSGETRTIVGYSAGRVVTVNVPFSFTPAAQAKYTISAVQAGHTWFQSPGLFSSSTCDMSTSANPCTLTFLPTVSGVYALEVQVLRSGGLQGNYYHNVLLQGRPALTRIDAFVDFDWGFGRVTTTAKDFVAVRWTGLVLPLYTEEYTFITNHTGFGPVLTVNGVELVNQIHSDTGCIEFDPSGDCLYRDEHFAWTMDFPSSGVQGVFSGTISLTAATLYDIRLDYKHRTGAASVQLWWKSASQRIEIVPSSSLFYPFHKAENSPFTMRVFASDGLCSSSALFTTDESLKCTSCGSVGTLFGAGLTTATAGTTATFNLQSKDQYGNIMDVTNAQIVARIDGNPSCGAPGTGRTYSGKCTPRVSIVPVETAVDGLHRYSFTPSTDVANTHISVSSLVAGGLFATYYTEADCMEVQNTRPKKTSGVASIAITSMGSSCTEGGTLSASGGGPGSRFSGTFTQRGGSIASVYITNAGHTYDSAPTITCCQQIYDVAISGTGTGYTNGGTLVVDCTAIPGCTGSGMVATCNSDGNTVSSITISEPGYGYNAAAPPLLTCPGGVGQTFTPSIDTSTGGAGCAGVEFTATMQFSSNGETWADEEDQVFNDWWGSDAGSAGATLTSCETYVPFRVRVDETVDFSGASSVGDSLIADWPGASASCREGSDFVVRWAGFVQPALAGDYTFQAGVESAEERLKLWVDNSILIDQWTSLSALSVSGTYGALSTTEYYSIKLEYREGVAAHKALLRWEGTSVAVEVVPSTSLFAAYQAENSPIDMKVLPSVPCSTTSASTGNGLTLSTAGVVSAFTLTAKDQFGNLRETLHDEASGYMYKPYVRISGLRTLYPTHVDNSDGLHQYSYNTTTAGTHTLNTMVAQAGGLHATYFDNFDLTGPLFLREDSVIDFSGTGDASSSTEWPGVTGEAVDGSSFGVAWTGFVRAPYEFVYTFSTRLSQQDDSTMQDRVRMWVDNELIIDQWTSLSQHWPSGTFLFLQKEALYDLTLEYKDSTGGQQVSLYWESDGPFAPAACDFSSPSPAPPGYVVDLCGWRLESTCDAGSSICVSSQATTEMGSANFVNNVGTEFGSSVSQIADMDGDGVLDVVVGAPADDTGAVDAGAIFILLLTTDGSLKSQAPVPASYVQIANGLSFGSCTSCLAAGDLFGSALTRMGDLDGNGVEDIAVVAKASVFILFMERDVSKACTVCPPQVLSYTKLDVTAYVGASNNPSSIALLDDLDGNGVNDIAIGNVNDATGGANYGAVVLLFLTMTDCASSATICISSTVTIADGVGNFNHDCTGGACEFGSSVALLGDVNGDSVPDLAVGARLDDCGGTDRGAVWILLMNKGSWTPQSATKICYDSQGMDSGFILRDGAEFGTSLTAAGDINGDGVPDLVVGSPKDEEPVAGTFNGAIYWIMLSPTGTVLDVRQWAGASDTQVTQTVGQAVGVSVALLSDLNRDGMPELVSGNAWDSSNDGSITVLLGASWKRWAGESTGSTGPSSPSAGNYFQYSSGMECRDGTMFDEAAGNTLNGEYSFLFDGTDADCSGRCSADALCNYYTQGSSNACRTARSCCREVASTDSTTVTYRKSSFLYMDASQIGDDTTPGVAQFVSRPGHYSSVSFWYYMYGATTDSLAVQIRSASAPLSSGKVASTTSGVEFTLDTNAPAKIDFWDGAIITIDGESRRIISYTAARQVTVNEAFSPAPTAGTSVYKVYERKSTCWNSYHCRHIQDWTEFWSISGEQQTTATKPWSRASISLVGVAAPIEVRFVATRGSTSLSNIALDRIQLLQFNSPSSSTLGVLRNTPLQIVPSSRLYFGLHTASSPFAVVVRPNIVSATETACTAGCDGAAQSASALHSVDVTLKDAFGNSRSEIAATESGGTVGRPASLYNTNHEDGLTVFLESQTNPNERIYGDVAFVSGADYTATYTPAGVDETATALTFASSELTVQVSRVGGLNGTYHRGMNLNLPVFERVDETIDFSFTQAFPDTGRLMPSDFFSVRWNGLIRPLADETYTFKTVTLSSSGSTGKEGVRLWLSGQHTGRLALVIDRWIGVDTEYTGTMSMLVNKLYDIQLEYKDTHSSSKIQLLWKSASQGASFVVVPSTRLYSSADFIADAPISVTVGA